MSPRRKKSFRKKSIKKKSQKKSKQNKTDQGKKKSIDNKIKRQSKIIAVLEHYIKYINKLEKTINNFEKKKSVKKIKSIRKIKKSNLRHDIPFDISMIKPNYQKTKRTMLEEERKKSIKNQTSNYQYNDISSQPLPFEPNIIISPQTSKKIRKTNTPESAKLIIRKTNPYKSENITNINSLPIIDELSDESTFTSPSSSYSSDSESPSSSYSESSYSSDSESSYSSTKRDLNFLSFDNH
jgi:hypothetical protein